QRHPVSEHRRHRAICGRPGGGHGAGHLRLYLHVHVGPGAADATVEVACGLQRRVHRPAADTFWRLGQHGQHRMAEISLSPLQHRPGGGGEDHLHPAAGQAVGV
ncbi:Sel1 repeat, partial [Dysosmobacter welbionis]